MIVVTSTHIIIIRFTVTSQRTTAQVRKYFPSVEKFYDFHKRTILLSVFTNVVLNSNFSTYSALTMKSTHGLHFYIMIMTMMKDDDDDNDNDNSGHHP